MLPLSRKDTLTPTAREVLGLLQPIVMCDYDETQSIGRRYRRQDEIGTPLCVTVDFDTLEDQAVTIRERDTTEQVRVPIDKLVEEIEGRLGAVRRRTGVLMLIRPTRQTVAAGPHGRLAAPHGGGARRSSPSVGYAIYAVVRNLQGKATSPEPTTSGPTSTPTTSSASSGSRASTTSTASRSLFLKAPWLVRGLDSFWAMAHFLVTAAVVIWLIRWHPRPVPAAAHGAGAGHGHRTAVSSPFSRPFRRGCCPTRTASSTRG